MARSQGYFVYLKHVLDQCEAGGDLASRELDKLPVGLMPYYEQQFERMQAHTQKREWQEIREPVLIQLAIAEQPLTLYELAAKAGVREPGRVQSALDQWRQFLIETTVSRNGRQVTAYWLFHESFRKFLEEWVIPEEERVVPEAVVSGTALVEDSPPRSGRPGN